MDTCRLSIIESRYRVLGCCFVNADLLAGLIVALELHNAVDLGKERIIAALAHVRSRDGTWSPAAAR